MSDKIKLIFVCRFEPWGENKQYPAFGVKYLIEIPIPQTEEDVFQDYFQDYYTDFFKKKFKE